MAWTLTTKAICAGLSGLPTTAYRDEWSDWVEGLIEDMAGIKYIGTTATVSAELHDGDNTDTLRVKFPPVISVTTLLCSDMTIGSSDYKVYPWGVRLVSSEGSELKESMVRHPRFPAGVQNVSITYVSGKASVPDRVQLCATLMINEIAKVQSREGSDASVKYGMVEPGMDERPTEFDIGLHKKLRAIAHSILQPRTRFR